jgi:hypothetical protein
MLDRFLTGGGAANLILVLVLCEFAVLWVRYRRGLGAPPGQWLSPLLAGAALVLALRFFQGGAPPALLGVTLAVAGLAHLMGYRQRWFR